MRRRRGPNDAAEECIMPNAGFETGCRWIHFFVNEYDSYYCMDAMLCMLKSLANPFTREAS